MSGRAAPSPGGQEATVASPFGEPPVFHRAGSGFADLFMGLRNL
jgi:alpha-glucosidase